MQLAIGLLIFSWIMLLAVVGFTFRDARNRRALTQKIKTLEEELAAEKDRAFNQSIDMAEKSVALLELKESLEQERERSEQLLRNILPERVIRVLQREGASKPELFDNVTVFFSDIVGFTRMSAELTPEALARFPDVLTVTKEDEDLEAVSADLCAVLDEALAAYNAMRAVEGGKLAGQGTPAQILESGMLDAVFGICTHAAPDGYWFTPQHGDTGRF